MDIEGENKTELFEFNVESIYVVENSLFLLSADDNFMYEYDIENGGEPKLMQ